MDIGQLESIRDKYREFSTDYDGAHIDMARWFVVHVGSRIGATPAEFEAAVALELDEAIAGTRLVFPCWVLSAPISGAHVQGRLPARPLGRFDKVLDRAHDGLLGHIAQRASLLALPYPEIALSSTIWRVAGVIEDIVDDRAPQADLHHQIAFLKSRLTNSTLLSAVEQSMCRVLDPNLSNWRNALTHIGRNDPWTFDRAADQAEQRQEEIWKIGVAVNLGVLDFLFERLRNAELPRGILDAVDRELAWIEG